jgi:hypothetical protein
VKYVILRDYLKIDVSLSESYLARFWWLSTHPLRLICTGQKLEKRDLCLYKVETDQTNRRLPHGCQLASSGPLAPPDIYPLWALRQLYPAHKVESARELSFLFLRGLFSPFASFSRLTSCIS